MQHQLARQAQRNAARQFRQNAARQLPQNAERQAKRQFPPKMLQGKFTQNVQGQFTQNMLQGQFTQNMQRQFTQRIFHNIATPEKKLFNNTTNFLNLVQQQQIRTFARQQVKELKKDIKNAHKSGDTNTEKDCKKKLKLFKATNPETKKDLQWALSITVSLLILALSIRRDLINHQNHQNQQIESDPNKYKEINESLINLTNSIQGLTEIFQQKIQKKDTKNKEKKKETNERLEYLCNLLEKHKTEDLNQEDVNFIDNTEEYLKKKWKKKMKKGKNRVLNTAETEALMHIEEIKNETNAVRGNQSNEREL